MPRALRTVSILLVLTLATACTTAAETDPDPAPDGEDAAVSSEQAMPSMPAAGTELDACEIVTPEDVANALDLDPADVADGVLTESPTTLSPGHTECDYTGEWGGLVVNLTPEDGANLFDAARGSYDDASDLEINGADSAFWSEGQGRGFFWKGAAAVMLQFSHLTTGAEPGEAIAIIGQAAMDKVD